MATGIVPWRPLYSKSFQLYQPVSYRDLHGQRPKCFLLRIITYSVDGHLITFAPTGKASGPVISFLRCSLRWRWRVPHDSPRLRPNSLRMPLPKNSPINR